MQSVGQMRRGVRGRGRGRASRTGGGSSEAGRGSDRGRGQGRGLKRKSQDEDEAVSTKRRKRVESCFLESSQDSMKNYLEMFAQNLDVSDLDDDNYNDVLQYDLSPSSGVWTDNINMGIIVQATALFLGKTPFSLFKILIVIVQDGTRS